jgi:hypothetical protein
MQNEIDLAAKIAMELTAQNMLDVSSLDAAKVIRRILPSSPLSNSEPDHNDRYRGPLGRLMKPNKAYVIREKATGRIYPDKRFYAPKEIVEREIEATFVGRLEMWEAVLESPNSPALVGESHASGAGSTTAERSDPASPSVPEQEQLMSGEKMDPRTLTQIEADHKEAQIRAAQAWAEVGYQAHICGDSREYVKEQVRKAFNKIHGAEKEDANKTTRS